MITKKKTIKSILGCTTACSALLMTGACALTLNQPKYETYAVGVDSIPFSISNSNFNSNTSSSYPYSPNNFTAYNHGAKVDSSNDDANVNAGVVNLSNEKYETRFSLAKRTSLDDYVLMIDSTDKDDENITHSVNYGFQTTSTFKLDANSKYMVSVDVFTATNAKIANLYLFDNVGEVYSSIEGINSYNNWTTYTFFVATNNIESLELKLGMYLEGAGTVLFDNIAGFKLSDSEYDFSVKSAVNGTYSEVDNIDNLVNRFYVNSLGQLEYISETNSKVTSNFNHVEYEFNKELPLEKATDSDGQNEYAVLVKNNEKTYSLFETDDIFTFEQNTIYKVSVSVKTTNLDGKASLQMIRTDLDEDDENYDAENHNKTISITSNSVSSSDSITNDYSTYSFLINSHPSKTLTYKLKFGLGTSETLTSGEMYLSEIEISKINYETYNSSTTGSGTEKINFVDAYSDNSLYLNNGDFNAFKIADYNDPMPATPIDWEVVTGSNKQAYGVVNTLTLSEDLKNLNLSNLRNPSSDNNNILMMYNSTADTLSFTSKAKSLSAKTYHKFTIDVQTQNAPATISLVSKKDEKEIVLSSKTINTNNAWETVTLYVYTGFQEIDISLKISLNTTGYGYTYADNATFDYALTSTQLETEFKNATNSTYVQIVDLSNLTASSSNDKFAPAELFSSENVSGVQSGTITLHSSYLDEVIDYVEIENGIDNNLTIFNSLATDKVLGIWTTEDVAYTMTSNIGFKITSGTDKYYKISVDVFTQNLGSNNVETDADLIGAGIKLSGFDNPFTSIKSNNSWTTYTFYLQGESDTTTYLELSLGSEDAKTKGSVFFGNITFADDITKSEFELAKENDNVNIIKTETTTEDDTDNETSTEKSNSSSDVNWFYLIPSLLTVLAILIALAGFAVRKIKWKKPTKKSKTAYDRNKTVSVQYYSRKATTMREEKVRELTLDLNKINAERKQYEDVYKQDLTKLREMKIKRANPTDIAKLEKELKKNQKMSSSLGVTANKISDELNYVQTSTYLNSLIKKLMREPSSQKENEDK